MGMMMLKLDNCPHCGFNLVGDLIADMLGEKVAIECYGGADQHWRKEVGVEVSGVYDGTLYYQCPECDGTWQRWAPGSGLHEKAAPYMRRGRIVVEINNNVHQES